MNLRTEKHGGSELRRRIANRETVVIDGANGTELERRGAPTDLPLWSARALVEEPELVAAIHAEYVAAGANVLTANTFRTQSRPLERGGWGGRASELTRRAVELARSAVPAGRAIAVVGSAPPLEDCYRPDLVPGDEVLRHEHGEHAEHLADAGVDAILVETMNCVRESLMAVRAARETDLPVLLSFTCCNGPELLSGETLQAALAAALPEAPAAVLVNCLPPTNVAACLPLLQATGLPFGVYPNLGVPLVGTHSAHSEDCSPAEFADLALGWHALGATLLGGCCGTTPAHIADLTQRLRN